MVTIELTTALQFSAQGNNEIGWLAKNAERWPVYCLDRDLASAPALADSARVCVFFRSGQRVVGLAGTQISLLAADTDLSVPPLPACFARRGSPLIGLALHRHAIVIIVSAQALSDFLLPLEAAHGS